MKTRVEGWLDEPPWLVQSSELEAKLSSLALFNVVYRFEQIIHDASDHTWV